MWHSLGSCGLRRRQVTVFWSGVAGGTEKAQEAIEVREKRHMGSRGDMHRRGDICRDVRTGDCGRTTGHDT